MTAMGRTAVSATDRPPWDGGLEEHRDAVAGVAVGDGQGLCGRH